MRPRASRGQPGVRGGSTARADFSPRSACCLLAILPQPQFPVPAKHDSIAGDRCLSSNLLSAPNLPLNRASAVRPGRWPAARVGVRAGACRAPPRRRRRWTRSRRFGRTRERSMCPRLASCSTPFTPDRSRIGQRGGAAGGVPGRARRQFTALEEQTVGPACAREMVEHAATGDAAADDDDSRMGLHGDGGSSVGIGGRCRSRHLHRNVVRPAPIIPSRGDAAWIRNAADSLDGPIEPDCGRKYAGGA